MKKLFVVMIVFLLASTVSAERPKFYLGTSYGLSHTDTGITNLTGTASLDEDGTGFKFFAGLKATDFFGIEIAYADLGETELKGNNGDGFTIDGTALTFIANGVSLKTEAKTFIIEAIGFLPLDKVTGKQSLKYFEPFAKVGVHFWEVDYTVTASGVSSATADDDGTDAVFGVGINFNIIDNVGARIEWERFITEEDIDFFSGGIVFTF